MSHWIADDIADYLAAHGIGVVGDDIFIDRIPAEPDDVVAVFERPGGPPLMTLTGGGVSETKADQPMIQIRVRAVKYTDGKTTAEAIFALLQGVTETVLVVGGGIFHLISAVQSPAHLGIDENQRHEWSQNFSCLWENPNR